MQEASAGRTRRLWSGAWGLGLLALVSAQLVTCAGPRVDASARVAAGEAADVWLAWASTDYAVHEPEGAALVLDVVLRNDTAGVTRSTSIAWEPWFADAYEVLESDPPAWRVHRTEDGWGVLDTSGVPPGEDGSFRVWFGAVEGAAPLDDDAAPRIRLVVDGELAAGEGVATPLHASERARLLGQQVFDRGSLAALADRAELVPAGAAGAYVVVVGLATLFMGIVALGLAAAYAATTQAAT